ncbi:MAG: geranylgeranylglyceryl/heptaprenylglyceryl phosphate synthase [Sphingomonadales bacterium]|nr:geranylgeranylglyceryl/heptaprenylglyceryl phosphate synthase [Sphingomonadales bacterium]
MKGPLYASLTQRKKEKKRSFAVLIDPDKAPLAVLDELIALGAAAKVDFWFVGGSLVVSHQLEEQVQYLKKHSDIPVILFPGSPSQVTRHADALLYLSLVSGRNADLLIGQHVLSAPLVKQSGLEVLATGYMVIDGGAPTTVSYISNATPIPSTKKEIAQCTALAAEMLGMKLIYLDAGSGALIPVNEEMIAAVASQIEVPLIVGGGITSPERATAACRAGADVIVVGNAIEKDRSLIGAISDAVHRSS